MEEATANSPGLHLDGNNRIVGSGDKTPCGSDSDAERQCEDRTPQQSERLIDNSIFNTISKIVNPNAKVSAHILFLSFFIRVDFSLDLQVLTLGEYE